MSRRFPGAVILLSLLMLGSSLGGLAVLAGWLRHLPTSPLVADIQLHPVQLPSRAGLEPAMIADYLQNQITARASNDVALRLTFGKEQAQTFIDAVLPRLVNGLVVQQMLDRIAPLKAVLATDQYRTLARIELRNAGSTALTDVVVTMPDAITAELADGAPVAVSTAATGLTALRLGTLEPGQSVSASAWLSAAQDSAGTLEQQIAVGAANGINGSLAIYGRQGWSGEDLEVQGWARWAIGAILLAVAAVALGMLVMLGLGGGRRRRISPA